MSDMSVNSSSGRHISQNHDSALTGADQKTQTANLEQQSKIGTEQHQKTMNFLAEKLAEMVQQDQRPRTAQASTENKSAPQTSTENNKGAANQSPDTGAANQSADANATNSHGGESEASFEANKKVAQQHSSEMADAQSTSTTESMAGEEGVASEELKKAKKASAEAASSTTSANSTSSANTEPEDLTNSLVDKLPGWGPPDPPAPAFPPGFSMESLASQTANDHEAVLAGLMAKMSEMMSEDALNRVKANNEYAKKSNEVSQASIKVQEAEHVENLRKAKEIEQWVGLGMLLVNILSVVISAVTLGVGAPVMTSLSLVVNATLLVVGIVDIGLAVAEQPTIMGTILEPFMTYVLLPLVEAVVEMCTEFFLACGLPEEIAEIVGAVVGIIVAAAIVICAFFALKGVGKALWNVCFSSTASTAAAAGATGAAAAAGAGAAAKGASAALQAGNTGLKATTNSTSLLSNSMTAIKNGLAKMDKLWERFASKLDIGGSQSIYKKMMQDGFDGAAAQAAKSVALQSGASKLVTGLNVASDSIGFVAVAGQGAGSIASGSYKLEGDMAHQLVIGLQQTLQTNQELLTEMNEMLAAMFQQSQEMMELALSVYKNQQQTAASIINNMAKGM